MPLLRLRIRILRTLAVFLLFFVLGSTLPLDPARGARRELRLGGFAIEHALVPPGMPETIYDAITGDISGWWDHTFSEKPAKFFLEAKPGGGFWEIFAASGDNWRIRRRLASRGGRRLAAFPLRAFQTLRRERAPEGSEDEAGLKRNAPLTVKTSRCWRDRWRRLQSGHLRRGDSPTLPATSIAPGHPVMTGQAGLRRSEAGAIMGTGNHEGLGRSNRA